MSLLPIISVSSAGIGRTGTYIALDILSKEGRDSGRIDVPGCVLNMRQNRPNIIQTLVRICNDCFDHPMLLLELMFFIIIYKV